MSRLKAPSINSSCNIPNSKCYTQQASITLNLQHRACIREENQTAQPSAVQFLLEIDEYQNRYFQEQLPEQQCCDLKHLEGDSEHIAKSVR